MKPMLVISCILFLLGGYINTHAFSRDKHSKKHVKHKKHGHHSHHEHHGSEYELSLLRIIFENKSAEKFVEEEGAEPSAVEVDENPFAFNRQSKIGLGGRLNIEFAHHWTAFVGASVLKTSLTSSELTNQFTDYELSGGFSYTFKRMAKRIYPYGIMEVAQVKKTGLVSSSVFEIEEGLEYALGIGVKIKISPRFFLEIENKVIKKFLFGKTREVKSEIDEQGRVIQIVEGRIAETNLDLDTSVDFSNTTIGFGVKL